MKRILLLVLLALFVSLGACSKYIPATMKVNEVHPKLPLSKDKATLVILRDSVYFNGSQAEANVFLDGEFIGTTVIESYFARQVAPGSHYIFSQAIGLVNGPISTSKLNFEAGKSYYLKHEVRQIPFSPISGVGTFAISPEEAKLSDKTYMDYKTMGGVRLKDKDKNEAIADYEKELKENPDKHKDAIMYKGY